MMVEKDCLLKLSSYLRQWLSAAVCVQSYQQLATVSLGWQHRCWNEEGTQTDWCQ